MQAAAKAAAAAEAASAARAAHEEACSTYTHDEVAALEFQAHTSAEPRNLRRKSLVNSQLRDPVCSAPERLHGPEECLKACFTPCCLCLEYLQAAAVLCMLVLREKAGSRHVQGDDADAHQAAAEPEEAPAQARPRSGSRAGTPLLEASDSGRKRGGEQQLRAICLVSEADCMYGIYRAPGMYQLVVDLLRDLSMIE